MAMKTYQYNTDTGEGKCLTDGKRCRPIEVLLEEGDFITFKMDAAQMPGEPELEFAPRSLPGKPPLHDALAWVREEADRQNEAFRKDPHRGNPDPATLEAALDKVREEWAEGTEHVSVRGGQRDASEVETDGDTVVSKTKFVARPAHHGEGWTYHADGCRNLNGGERYCDANEWLAEFREMIREHKTYKQASAHLCIRPQTLSQIDKCFLTVFLCNQRTLRAIIEEVMHARGKGIA